MKPVAAFALGLTIAGCNPSSTKSVGSVTDAPAAIATSSTPSAAASTPPSVVNPRVSLVDADGEVDALSLIRTKRLAAKGEGRVLVVYVGATWCEPCKRLKSELRSGRLDERLSKVSFLVFDADRDADRLGAAGYAYRFVPFVALPGADGRPADSVQATGRGGEAWRELLGKLDAWQHDLR